MVSFEIVIYLFTVTVTVGQVVSRQRRRNGHWPGELINTGRQVEVSGNSRTN